MRKNKFSLDKFIEHSLYNKSNGYYMKNNPIGDKGDFITAPEISVLFSEMISIWLVGFWENLGKPKKINIIELGAGTGEMMFQINKSLKNFEIFKKNCEFYILEKSPQLMKIQKKKNRLFKIKWIDNLNKIKSFPTIIIANEFFDALPVKQYKKLGRVWYERYVVKNKDKYEFKDEKIQFLEIEKNLGEKVRGYEKFIEFSPRSIEKISEISKIIKKNNGGALIIDYGYLGKKMLDTVQSVKNHKKTDILKNIYQSDITHLLNFNFYKKKFNKKLDKIKIISQRKEICRLQMQY